MGDTSASPAGDYPSNANPQLPHDASGGLSPLTADGRTSSSAAGQHHGQADAQFAFSNQLDIGSPSPSGRQNAYNMAPMANSLPNVAYRGGQYSQGTQSRYQQQASSPSMMQQMPHMGHYGSQQSLGMSDGNYYGQQQMPQYYGGGQMPSSHGAASISSRQNMQYYQPQVAMSPSPTGYYYSQMGQFPGQGHAMMGQMGGHYGSQGSPGLDPRYTNSMLENQNQHSGGPPRPLISK